jgi:hypothetical protein
VESPTNTYKAHDQPVQVTCVRVEDVKDHEDENEVFKYYCPMWCTGKHHGGKLFEGWHTGIQQFSPPPTPPGYSGPIGPTWFEERLLIAGESYTACISSELGSAVIEKGETETVKEFEARIPIARTRIMSFFKRDSFKNKGTVNLIEYIQGF